ncbi:T9SS C-terminal target domain-containing protein, partial [Olleya sp. AH-315-F22]|nr:T9SS C-terminal target domain-containing protein [Olleya sp. AH-315-F22]
MSLSQAQITNIPDSNFEKALVDLEIDLDGEINGQVLTDDIDDIVNLNIFNKGIADLTGIEGFTSLEVLNCANNDLETIDISNNLELIELNCSSNN